MWPFSRRTAAPPPRIQTLAEMISYALGNETLRAGWKLSKNELKLAHSGLGIALTYRYPRQWDVYQITGRNGAVIPFGDQDRARISAASRRWREWDDERIRTEGLLNFVDAFEKVAAQAGEAGTAGTTQIGPVHEHAVPQGCAHNLSRGGE
jgi:hypothetical protein